MRRFLVIMIFMVCELSAGELVTGAAEDVEDTAYWYTIEILETGTLDLVGIDNKLKRVCRVNPDAVIVLEVVDKKLSLEKLIIVRDKILTLNPNDRVFIKYRDLTISVNSSKMRFETGKKSVR